MNIIEYLKENKVIVLLVIVVLFILWVWYRKVKLEGMDGTISKGTMRLKYNKNGDIYYLGLLDKGQCYNLKKAVDTVCQGGVAVLQKQKTPSSAFSIIQRVGGGAYFLVSHENSKLCHNLNSITPNPYMCFCLGAAPAGTNFTVETGPNGGNILVFTQQVTGTGGAITSTPYYLSECGATGLCKFRNDIYLKVCLTTNKANAIEFSFVGVDNDSESVPLPKSEIASVTNATNEMVNVTSEHVMKRGALMTGEHTFSKGAIMGENHSLESFDNISKYSTNILPNYEDDHEYASWDSKN